MTFAGLLINLGFMFLNAAVVSGKGALAMAIIQTQSFFWLLLEIIINLRIPKSYEALGMSIGICGAVVIALAKK